MTRTGQIRNRFFGISPRATTAALAIALVLTVVASQAAQAQTYKVLYNFTGGQGGGYPLAGLTIDRAGNLYGTASELGNSGDGTVFKLSYKGSEWIFAPLYSFQGGSDGAGPKAEVTIAPDGVLYGTTFGGGSYAYGTVFNLRPSATSCKTVLCPWNENLIHAFSGGSDGGYPSSDLVFDRGGNLYGSTSYGGDLQCDAPYGCGIVYEFKPSSGGWTEMVLYAFQNLIDGNGPSGRVLVDDSGNLYGVTEQGGAYNCGTVFHLTQSGSGWSKSTIYTFQCGDDGAYPSGGLVFDPSGNLYGTTQLKGTGNGGTVFKLTSSGGNWVYSVLYPFDGNGGPTGSLVIDASGHLYGTTNADGAYQLGSVFELTPSNGGWTYTSLHDFTGDRDGANPFGNLTRDADGNLYGTTYGGYGEGGVWEITP